MSRGQYAQAEQDAVDGLRMYGDSSPEWSWRFRVLRAEVLVWRGMSKDAVPLISQEPPQNLSYQVQIRREVVLGTAYCFLQQFEDSDRLLSTAMALASQHAPELSGDVYLAQGVSAVVRSNYTTAREGFEHALQAARQQHDLFLEASALGNLGIVSTRSHRYDEAVGWYESALHVSEELGNRASLAKVKGNLGWCYLMLGDFDRALDLLQQAQKLSADLGAVKDEQIWVANIGALYTTTRDFKSAELNLTQALAIATKLQNRALQAITLNDLTRAAIARNDFDRAAEYDAQADQLNRIADDRTYALYSVFNKGAIARGKGNLADAEKYFRQVIEQSAENASLRWEAQSSFAKTLVLEGAASRADAEFKQALSSIDAARSTLSAQDYRLSFLNTATEFYNDYIDFLISRGRVEEALAVAEHSRARTLAEGLGVKLTSLESKMAGATEIARGQHAVILAYWLKPEHSYLWAITANKVTLFTLPADTEIDAAVQGYRKALVGPRDPLETANPTGQQLYQMLVAPAQKLIPANSRVVIIADGSLYGLNFETLLAPSLQLHYWIDDVTVSNANSLAMLRSSVAANPQPAKSRLLLIGNPVSASSDFPPLPQAESEIHEVAAHFAEDQETVIDGPKATAASYMGGDPSDFSYIHFVAHGTASRLSPLDSAVILSPQGDAYKLYARDIVEKPLRADLVTISACYGSGNRAYSGEGLVGLSWAFLRAGARNVIAALWEANDVSTPKLMDAMYTRIGSGDDPAIALRKAKLALLHSGSVYRRPFYWAPFQLYVGPGQAMHASKRENKSTADVTRAEAGRAR